MMGNVAHCVRMLIGAEVVALLCLDDPPIHPIAMAHPSPALTAPSGFGHTWPANGLLRTWSYWTTGGLGPEDLLGQTNASAAIE